MATVHRFFVAQPLLGGDVALAPEIAHQLSAVLRLRHGDPLVLFDGSGGEWQAELIGIGREGARGAMARLLRHERPLREADLEVTLCPALLKADKLEWVLQKGTELGAVAFQPVVTRRTVAGGRGEKGVSHGRASAVRADRLAPGSAGTGARIARWRRIVVEAAEQSGRCVVPRVAEPLPLPAVLENPPATVLLWEGERVVPFAAALAKATVAGQGQVRLLVGPEGGFDPQEADLVIAAGARPASLGPRLLRSETAALAALTLALIPSTLGPHTAGPA
ncbi:MAG: 16S rRNA (uracil(1498)-N(3))-methyltransferase [Chloroflexota bacterium]|nr:16S rRNA (uracil(1498)-N(3))-methyltransferase [Chloroflexota bacterium]